MDAPSETNHQSYVTNMGPGSTQGSPFEPLEQADLKIQDSFTARPNLYEVGRRVACIRFTKKKSKVILRPNPAFVPKVIKPGYSRMEIEIQAFHPPLSESPRIGDLQHLCPTRALRIYLEKTQVFRQSENLFV